MRWSRLMPALLVLTVTAATVAVVVPRHADAAGTTVCARYCDTRDPSLAKQETFPVVEKTINGRRVDDLSGMGWASIDGGATNDGVWIDRSWDGGATWDGSTGTSSAAPPTTPSGGRSPGSTPTT